jgi:hypothetical protein
MLTRCRTLTLEPLTLMQPTIMEFRLPLLATTCAHHFHLLVVVLALLVLLAQTVTSAALVLMAEVTVVVALPLVVHLMLLPYVLCFPFLDGALMPNTAFLSGS